MTNTMGTVIYHEEQQFHQIWLWLLLITVSLLLIGVFGTGMISQLLYGKPWGNHPMSNAGLIVTGCFAFFLGIVLPALLLITAKLVTEVKEDGIHYRFRPFHSRFLHIPLAEIQSWEAVTYQPLLEYGGWGIRYGPSGRAYNVSGNRGVRLKLQNGQRLLFGSQNPEAFDRAVQTVKNRTHLGGH